MCAQAELCVTSISRCSGQRATNKNTNILSHSSHQFPYKYSTSKTYRHLSFCRLNFISSQISLLQIIVSWMSSTTGEKDNCWGMPMPWSPRPVRKLPPEPCHLLNDYPWSWLDCQDPKTGGAEVNSFSSGHDHPWDHRWGMKHRWISSWTQRSTQSGIKISQRKKPLKQT